MYLQEVSTHPISFLSIGALTMAALEDAVLRNSEDGLEVVCTVLKFGEEKDV